MSRRILSSTVVAAVLLLLVCVPGARAATYGPSWNQFRYDECPAKLQGMRWRDYRPPSNSGIGDYSFAVLQGDVDVCYDEYVADRAPGAVYDVWVVVLRSKNRGFSNNWNSEEANASYRVGVRPYANTTMVSSYSGGFTKASCRDVTIPVAVGSGAFQVGTEIRLSSCAPFTQSSVAWNGNGRLFTLNAVAGMISAEQAVVVKTPVGRRPLFELYAEVPYGTRSYVDAPSGRIYKETIKRYGVTTYI